MKDVESTNQVVWLIWPILTWSRKSWPCCIAGEFYVLSIKDLLQGVFWTSSACFFTMYKFCWNYLHFWKNYVFILWMTLIKRSNILKRIPVIPLKLLSFCLIHSFLLINCFIWDFLCVIVLTLVLFLLFSNTDDALETPLKA